jgi:sulfur-carrier protein
MRVLFFGRLRDLAGASEIEISEAVHSIDDLKALLGRANPALALALNEPSVRVAIDRAFAADDAPLRQAQEIAFMPPLSGG